MDDHSAALFVPQNGVQDSPQGHPQEGMKDMPIVINSDDEDGGLHDRETTTLIIQDKTGRLPKKYNVTTEHFLELLDADSALAAQVTEHDVNNGPLNVDVPSVGIFGMVIKYHRTWSLPSSDVERHSLITWIKLRDYARNLPSSEVHDFAIEQMVTEAGCRLTERPGENFTHEVRFIRQDRDEEDELHGFFIDIFRCAGLCDIPHLTGHDWGFVAQLVINVHKENRGGKGAKGLAEKFPTKTYKMRA